MLPHTGRLELSLRRCGGIEITIVTKHKEGGGGEKKCPRIRAKFLAIHGHRTRTSTRLEKTQGKRKYSRIEVIRREREREGDWIEQPSHKKMASNVQFFYRETPSWVHNIKIFDHNWKRRREIKIVKFFRKRKKLKKHTGFLGLKTHKIIEGPVKKDYNSEILEEFPENGHSNVQFLSFHGHGFSHLLLFFGQAGRFPLFLEGFSLFLQVKK